MANVKDNAAAQETRRKLIDAAGQVFAERGLHAATLQEITARAGVNKAAVNYHFRDKFELYAAVVRYCLSFSDPCPVQDSTGTPEARLRAWILHVIREILDPARPSWRAAIINHELAQPTAALDAVMEELIAPRSRHQCDIVRSILGPRASEEKVAPRDAEHHGAVPGLLARPRDHGATAPDSRRGRAQAGGDRPPYRRFLPGRSGGDAPPRMTKRRR